MVVVEVVAAMLILIEDEDGVDPPCIQISSLPFLLGLCLSPGRDTITTPRFDEAMVEARGPRTRVRSSRRRRRRICQDCFCVPSMKSLETTRCHLHSVGVCPSQCRCMCLLWWCFAGRSGKLSSSVERATV